MEIQSATQIGQKLVVTFKDLENENSPHAFTNVGVAAFISSWARVRLYELLDIVGMERLIYCDTDSVIYVQKRGEPLLLTTGNYLGQLTNEIKDGWEIQIFIGLGAKNYAYCVKNLVTGEMEYVYKIRSITLNYRAREVIDFNDFYNLVTHKRQSRNL